MPGSAESKGSSRLDYGKTCFHNIRLCNHSSCQFFVPMSSKPHFSKGPLFREHIFGVEHLLNTWTKALGSSKFPLPELTRANRFNALRIASAMSYSLVLGSLNAKYNYFLNILIAFSKYVCWWVKMVLIFQIWSAQYSLSNLLLSVCISELND